MSKRKNRTNRKKDFQASAARFRLHPKASEVANLMDDRASIDYLRRIFEQSSSILQHLRDCVRFDFLDEVHIEEVGQYSKLGQSFHFWTQTNQLIILASKTSSRAILNLVDGLCLALASKNELVLALTSRAFLEHTASLYSLEQCLIPFQDRLQNIWESGLNSSQATSLTNDDKELRQELLRFVVGRRVQMAPDIPTSDDSNTRWRKFNDALHEVPEQFKAKQILTSINSLSNQKDIQYLRATYDFLCEYCHPNSASRTLDFNVAFTDLGRHFMNSDANQSLSAGLRSIYSLFQPIVAPCCNAIENSLATLSRCQMPMDAPSEKLESPPIGGLPIVDRFGRIGWAQSQRFLSLSLFGKAPLSEQQLEKINEIHERFGDAISTAAEVWSKYIAEHGPDVEEEIRLWEHLAEVYEAEVNERRLNAKHRKLLFIAIIKCSYFQSLGDVLSANPELKGFPAVDRVFAKVRGI
jgi:hypothetical protein